MSDEPVALQIRVLGPLQLTLDGRDLPVPVRGRERALLGYLALRPAPIPRTEVRHAPAPRIRRHPFVLSSMRS